MAAEFPPPLILNTCMPRHKSCICYVGDIPNLNQSQACALQSYNSSLCVLAICALQSYNLSLCILVLSNVCNFGQPCILAQIGLVEHVDHLSSHMPYTITDAIFSNTDAIFSNTYNYHHQASSHPTRHRHVQSLGSVLSCHPTSVSMW